MLNPAQVEAAIAKHGTVFFDADLNPVVPQVGQWFCEYVLVIPEKGDNYIQDDALVEYAGPDDSVVWDDSFHAFLPYGAPMLRHRVVPEYSDSDRRVQGGILIRQS
jgi:hypothetical protein